VSSNNKRMVAAPAGLLPVVKALLTGMAIHPLKGHAEDYKVYRARIQKVMDSLGDSVTLEEAYPQAEEAVHALRDHGLRTAKRLYKQDTELRAIVKLLMETLEDLRIASPERTKQLMEVANQLGGAAEAEELRVVKASLADCLATIRKEAERELSLTGPPGTDGITDLPGRPAAEAALVEACSGETPLCAVIMMVDRIALYNRRYGREAGDKVLRYFVDFVRRAFGAQDLLYRWTGPAILLLREGTLDKVQAEGRRILEPRLQYDFEVSSRTILLTVDACWSVLPMMVDPRLLINKIDAFLTY
jgi:GGDEF domain-containing protein